MARKKVRECELTPKSDKAKERLSYHGTRWTFKRESMMPYPGAPKYIHVGLESRDGKKFLWILKYNDPDFEIRKLF